MFSSRRVGLWFHRIEIQIILDKIARQTFRASEIVNSLLNFSRTSTSELTEVQLNRVIQETLSLLEHQFRKSAIEVRVRLDPTLDPVKGNPGKLQQVFLNLFMNARDAMERAPGSEAAAGPKPHRLFAEYSARTWPGGSHRTVVPFAPRTKALNEPPRRLAGQTP
jgi:signal transduction histidine kinase